MLSNTVVAVYLDGTLAEYNSEDYSPETVGAPKEGAKEFLELLKKNNNKIIIFTARKELEPIYEWLVENEIPFDEINPKTGDEYHSHKIFAEYYIDDRGLRFSSWEDVKRFIEEDTKGADKVLYGSEWFTIKLTNDNYAYLEEPEGVVIFPYKMENKKQKYLLRNEMNPLFGKHKTLITGRIDDDETPVEAAIRELEEEAGILAEKSRFTELGEVHLTKATVGKETFFLVNVTDLEENIPTTDGSISEKKSNNFWINESKLKEIIKKSSCSYLSILYSKLLLNKPEFFNEAFSEEMTISEGFDRMHHLEDFLRSDFVYDLIKSVFDTREDNILDLVRFGKIEHLAFYDPKEESIVFDYESFHTLLETDMKKLYKVLVHELTHLVQDSEGRLEVPKEDIALNYFENPSEVEALDNEIRYFKFEGLSIPEIEEIFETSFSRFGDEFTDDLKVKLKARIDGVN